MNLSMIVDGSRRLVDGRGVTARVGGGEDVSAVVCRFRGVDVMGI